MALYLGKDKIASNGTITGDTLPVGTIVEYDGTEVPANWELFEGEEGSGIPEITEQDLFLADLDDGIYKCSYMHRWASREEKEASLGGGLAVEYTNCYLIKETPISFSVGFPAPPYDPFTVRMIHIDHDIVINVDANGMTESIYSLDITTYDTLQNDARSMSSKIAALEEKMAAVYKIEVYQIGSSNDQSYYNTYTITPGMTWQDIVDDTDFINYQGDFTVDEYGYVKYWEQKFITLDPKGTIYTKATDIAIPGRRYYIYIAGGLN